LNDSFGTFLKDKGHNYNDLLQQYYLARGTGAVEIVNTGMESIGPGYYWHILHKFGDLIKPDLVLVGFFVGNDFQEAELLITIGNIISEPKDLSKKYLQYYQFSNLRLYKLLRNKYILYYETQKKKEEINSLPSHQVGYFSQDNFLEIERTRSWIFDQRKQNLLNEEWQKCTAILLKIKDWCEARQIKLVIIIFPDQFQVDEELRIAVLKRYKNIHAQNFDLAYPNNLIVNFCKAQNLDCLDLLEQFQEQGKTQPLYSLRNTHWNAAGNRLAADMIFRYLEDRQLVPMRRAQ
jgi:hypothetical protein